MRHKLIDLETAPPSNAYVSEASLGRREKRLPLRVLVCEQCWLVQTEDHVSSTDVFDDSYAYFSSYSTSWLSHCERFAESSINRFGLGDKSIVVEVASNDGYLLRYYQAHSIPCLGIEPTASTAAAARSQGIPTLEEFFGRALGRRLARNNQADLIVAINVLAHVPDINDFASGFAELLKPEGVAVFEFPHLLRLIEGGQFDTIYHEHFSYLSLASTSRILNSAGLSIFDVEQLPTHGGSIRVYAQPAEGAGRAPTARLASLRHEEHAAGVESKAFYSGLQEVADRCRNDLLVFLAEQRHKGMKVAAYGAAAKGNTLLNYAGVDPTLVAAVADANPAKRGKYLPGSHIPIVSEQQLRAFHPDYVLILPWNLKQEILQQLDYLRSEGTRFVTAVPRLEVLE